MTQRTLFLVNPGSSRERRVGVIVSTTGEGDEAVHTIEVDGETFERAANACMPSSQGE